MKSNGKSWKSPCKVRCSSKIITIWKSRSYNCACATTKQDSVSFVRGKCLAEVKVTCSDLCRHRISQQNNSNSWSVGILYSCNRNKESISSNADPFIDRKEIWACAILTGIYPHLLLLLLPLLQWDNRIMNREKNVGGAQVFTTTSAGWWKPLMMSIMTIMTIIDVLGGRKKKLHNYLKKVFLLFLLVISCVHWEIARDLIHGKRAQTPVVLLPLLPSWSLTNAICLGQVVFIQMGIIKSLLCRPDMTNKANLFIV